MVKSYAKVFWVAAVLLSVVGISVSFAQDDLVTGKEHYLRRSEKIIKSAHEGADKALNLADIANVDLAADIARRAEAVESEAAKKIQVEQFMPPSIGEHAPNLLTGRQDASAPPERKSLIFVSNSMPDEELRDAFRAAALWGAPVVFRGVLKGQSFEQTFKRAFALSKGIDGIPGIQIDPRPFEEFGVAVVPAVVIWQGENAVKVSGTLSVTYARQRFDAQRFGDAGSRGKTYAIVEPDLIKEMQERFSKIDWEEKKRAAIARFWSNQKLHALPRATETRVSYFDPTVVNQDDIRDPNGKLIAPGGSSFNPLDLVNFSKVLIAFDVTDKAQCEHVRKIVEKEMERGIGVILVTSHVDRERGWEAMREYNELFFPNQVFLLDELVAGRFGLKSVPSVVRQDGRRFKIEELAVGG